MKRILPPVVARLMRALVFSSAPAIAIGFAFAGTIGCSSTGESASIDTLTANVGKYDPPPSSVLRPRVGVPPLDINGGGSAFGFNVGSSSRLQKNAADQLTTLWHQSRRFSVIERAQLDQLLREQDLEGIVRPDELAMINEIRGVDYLCLGKVTNFEVRVDRNRSAVGVGGSSSRLNERIFGQRDPLDGFQGGFDRRNVTITVSCGVDLRLVDPSTGEIAVAETADVNRELQANSLGFDLDIFRTEADADIRITESDAGKLLRLALDQTIREMLPEVDAMLVREWDEDRRQADEAADDPS